MEIIEVEKIIEKITENKESETIEKFMRGAGMLKGSSGTEIIATVGVTKFMEFGGEAVRIKNSNGGKKTPFKKWLEERKKTIS